MSWAANIEIEAKNVFDVNKEHFLANGKNQQSFINLLGKKLNKDGMTVYHAKVDADTKIISEALLSARQINTTYSDQKRHRPVSFVVASCQRRWEKHIL